MPNSIHYPLIFLVSSQVCLSFLMQLPEKAIEIMLKSLREHNLMRKIDLRVLVVNTLQAGALLGASQTGVNPEFTTSELSEYITKTACRCIFTTSELLDNVSKALEGSSVGSLIESLLRTLSSLAPDLCCWQIGGTTWG